ncbi:MAG: metal ABC transporter permease [Ardenticatenaceae bacterium]
MISWLTDPFVLSFMQRGLLAGILVGISCAVLGAYVVWRGMAFIGDALAHTILPGIVVASLNGWNLFFGALGAGILTALGIGWLTRQGEVEEDTAIGIVFSGAFAFGILLLSTVNSYRDLTHILFGNILGVSRPDLLIIAIVTAIVLLAVTLLYKELLVTSFDSGHAAVIGLSADRVRYGLLILLALAIVTGIQTVGVVLVSALLITPAAAASLLTNRLPLIMLIASIISALATVTGMLASYYADVSSGATIVLVCTGAFVVAFLFAPQRGYLVKRW